MYDLKDPLTDLCITLHRVLKIPQSPDETLHAVHEWPSSGSGWLMWITVVWNILSSVGDSLRLRVSPEEADGFGIQATCLYPVSKQSLWLSHTVIKLLLLLRARHMQRRQRTAEDTDSSARFHFDFCRWTAAVCVPHVCFGVELTSVGLYCRQSPGPIKWGRGRDIIMSEEGQRSLERVVRWKVQRQRKRSL